MNTLTTTTTGFNQKTVFIFDTTEGMTLSKDVIDSKGHLIASKDTVLDSNLISRIAGYHILEVSIYDMPASLISLSEESVTYYQNIKQSTAFINFKNQYMENVSQVKDHLNNFVLNNAPLNPSALISGPVSILSKYKNNLQLFDMLHCIREFDDSTYIHCINVSLIASIIGKWMNFSEKDVETITLCGLLHDIGKLEIPPEILTKPGRLTDNEYAIMKNHVNLGYSKLNNQKVLTSVKEACLLHHEKCDGSGYPFGLHSNKIPDFTKIITIADIYDAMTANRVYRDAICPFEVIQAMETDAFTKYDPRFMLPFLKHVVDSYMHNTVRLSDGRLGTVVLINNDALSRPVVQCKDEFVNLSKERDIKIVAII